MKKTFLTIITLSTFFFTNAQDFGLRAGLNYSKQKDNFIDKNDFKLGYQIGVTSKMDLGKNISFNPSLVWSTKGYKLKNDLYTNQDEGLNLNMKLKEIVNLNYIEMPLNLGYTLKLGKVNPIIQAGPYLSYLISGKHTSYLDNKKYPSHKIDVRDLNRFDYGLNFSLGAEISKFQVLANYAYGIGNQIKNSNSDYYIKNRSFQLMLNYYFKKGE